MDQLPFDFKLTIIGCELDMFYNLLISGGFEQQAKDLQEQVKEQLSDTNPKTDELSIGAVGRCASCKNDSNFSETAKQEICIEGEYRYVTATTCNSCGTAIAIEFFD